MNKEGWLPVLFAVAVILSGTIVSAQNTSTLPISMDLRADLSGSNKVVISWTILLKLNTDYFDVEKSHDGIGWNSMAVVKPDTSFVIPCHYTRVDLFPVRGANFYRIRMRDATGRTTFTPMKLVRVTAFCNISVYPNPAFQQVNISLGQAPAKDWSVLLISAKAKRSCKKGIIKTI